MDRRTVFIELNCTTNRLVAAPEAAGEACSAPRSWIKGWATGMWRREGKDGVGEEWGRVEEEGRGKT